MLIFVPVFLLQFRLVHRIGWLRTDFALSVSSRRNLQTEKMDLYPRPPGCDRHCHKMEARAFLIMMWISKHRDRTCSSGVTLMLHNVSLSASQRHTVSLSDVTSCAKKTDHAVEQSYPDLLEMLQSCPDIQLDLDPARLVFIDQTWTATNLPRTHGRFLKGKWLRMGYPHGHRKTTALVAALRNTGMIGPLVINGSVYGEWFEVYVSSRSDKAIKSSSHIYPVTNGYGTGDNRSGRARTDV